MRAPAVSVLGLICILIAQPLLAQSTSQDGQNPPEAAETQVPEQSVLEELEEIIPFSDAVLEEAAQVMRASSTPQSGYDPTKPVVGFGISKNLRGAHIDVVVPNSAAEGAGLDVGMTILSINGIALADFETSEVVKIIGAIEGEVVFVMADGRTVSLTKAPIPQTGE